MSLFTSIQNLLDELSEAKKKVAYYILENWLEAAFLPASKVAKNCKVSESVVVRFSQDLDFSGFPEFQSELQTILKSRLVQPKSNVADDEFHQKDTNKELEGVYNNTIENINEVFTNNAMSTFLEFKDKIINGDKILILARQNSYGPAFLLDVHLNEIFAKSKIMNGESVESLDYIRGLKENDLVIFISIPSYSKRMRLYSDLLKEKGVPQIAISNTYNNSIGKNADTLLLTSVNSLSYSNSHLGTLFIIDILLYLLTVENKSTLLKYIEDSKLLNERFDITD